MPAIDLHQHLWPEAFAGAAAQPDVCAVPARFDAVHRHRAAVRRPIRPTTTSTRRIALDRDAGIGLACVSLSAPLGIETLPRDDAVALIDAWHLGVSDASGALRRRGPRPRRWTPTSTELDELLAGRFVGVQLPANLLATPGRLAGGR